MSLLVWVLFDFFEIINYEVTNVKFPYILASFFLIWVIFEVIFKNNIEYILLIYFFSIPLQNWIGEKGFLILFINNISITFHLVFWIIFFLKSLKKEEYTIKHIDLKFYLGFFILLFASISSILNSRDVLIAANGVIYGIILPFLIFLTLLNFIDYGNDIEKIYRLLSIVLLFYNIFTFLVSFSTFFLPHISRRVIGVFNNPNDVMFIQIIAIGISLFFIHYKREKIYFIHLLIAITIVLLTGTRSSVVLIILFSLVYGKRYFRDIKIFVLINLVSVIVIIILFFYWEHIINEFSLLNRFISKGFESGRFLAWEKTISFIKSEDLYLWGIGIANYNLFNISNLVHAHNSFLQLTTSIGLLSSIIFHFLIISQIKIINIFMKNNFFYNLPKIILITFIGFFSINAFTLTITKMDVNYIDISIRAIYLWIFMSISYLINKKFSSAIS